jgi:transposase
MRYDLTDFEWSVIEPLLPMDRRGPKPQNNPQVQWYLLGTARRVPWRDLAERYGLYISLQLLQSCAGPAFGTA